jgi:hypothetical protein
MTDNMKTDRELLFFWGYIWPAIGAVLMGLMIWLQF